MAEREIEQKSGLSAEVGNFSLNCVIVDALEQRFPRGEEPPIALST